MMDSYLYLISTAMSCVLHSAYKLRSYMYRACDMRV